MILFTYVFKVYNIFEIKITRYSTVNYMVHYTLILEGKYRLSIGRLSFPHTCHRAQQKLSDILVYLNIFKLEINLDHMYYYSICFLKVSYLSVYSFY